LYFAIYGIPTVINRCSCLFGLWQHGVCEQGWIDWFVEQIVRGNGELEIFGNGRQVRDVLDGRDVAELIYQEFIQIEKIKGKVFNIGGGMANRVSLLEAIQEIEKQSNKKAILKFYDWRPADHKFYASCLDKVKKHLNWKPKISFIQTIKDMIYDKNR